MKRITADAMPHALRAKPPGREIQGPTRLSLPLSSFLRIHVGTTRLSVFFSSFYLVTNSSTILSPIAAPSIACVHTRMYSTLLKKA